jgi:ABC-type transport system substrate-binding protein
MRRAHALFPAPARSLALALTAALLLGGCGGDAGEQGSSSRPSDPSLKPLPELVISYGNNSRPYMPNPNEVATQIAIVLRDVGFDVQLRKEEWASYLNLVKNGKHQMALMGWSADYPDADNFLYVLLDKENAVEGSANNISFYRDEQVHEWLTAARQSHDTAERLELYKKAQEKIFDDCPMIPLVYTQKAIAFRKGFGPLDVEAMMHPLLRLVTEPKDGTLVFLRGQDSVRLDPGDVSDGESSKVIEQVFDTLTRFTPGTTDVEPSLATSWTSSKDHKTWTFQIRAGVSFHDGSPVDGEAVVNAFERQRDPKHPQHFPDGSWEFWQGLFGFVEKVELGSGPMEVVFRMNAPAPPFFLAQLAQFSASIPSKKALDELGEKFRRAPVGSGPFRFVSWDSDVAITLERNEDYWDGAPALKQVVFRIGENATVRSRRLRDAQQADLIDNLDLETIAALEQDPNVTVVRKPGTNVCYLSLNNLRPPFDDKRVRQAIAWALSHARIVKYAYRDLALPATTPVPPTLPAHHKGLVLRKRDVEKAKALLREAGYDAH